MTAYLIFTVCMFALGWWVDRTEKPPRVYGGVFFFFWVLISIGFWGAVLLAPHSDRRSGPGCIPTETVGTMGEGATHGR